MKHTRSIKMCATFLATVGIICFASIPAMADEPTWWTQQKKDCGLPSDLAYDNWDGKCDSSPDGSASTPGYDDEAARRAQAKAAASAAKHLRQKKKTDHRK